MKRQQKEVSYSPIKYSLHLIFPDKPHLKFVRTCDFPHLLNPCLLSPPFSSVSKPLLFLMDINTTAPHCFIYCTSCTKNSSLGVLNHSIFRNPPVRKPVISLVFRKIGQSNEEADKITKKHCGHLAMGRLRTCCSESKEIEESSFQANT